MRLLCALSVRRCFCFPLPVRSLCRGADVCAVRVGPAAPLGSPSNFLRSFPRCLLQALRPIGSFCAAPCRLCASPDVFQFDFTGGRFARPFIEPCQEMPRKRIVLLHRTTVSPPFIALQLILRSRLPLGYGAAQRFAPSRRLSDAHGRSRKMELCFCAVQRYPRLSARVSAGIFCARASSAFGAVCGACAPAISPSRESPRKGIVL